MAMERKMMVKWMVVVVKMMMMVVMMVMMMCFLWSRLHVGDKADNWKKRIHQHWTAVSASLAVSALDGCISLFSCTS